MSNVTRGEKLMNRLVNEQRLTPSGKDWLVAALDPFHDNQLANLEGWPDTECGASVVRCIKLSAQLTVPSTVTSGQNWDAHVVMWPWLQNIAMIAPSQRSGNMFQGVTYPAPLTPPTDPMAQLGGCQVFGMPSGQPLRLDYNNPSSVVRSIATLRIDPVYTKGSGRIIGAGFEIHNTTAEIYKQGSCCVYRQQADARDISGYKVRGGITAPVGNYEATFTGSQVRCPPQTLAQAMLMSGSRQWTAEEGCYQVAAFYSDENAAIPTNSNVPLVFLSADYDDDEASLNTEGLMFPVPQYIGSQYGENFSTVCERVHPFHQSGAIFTGLSYNTTLTLNFNVFYESFPSMSDPNILALAKPSAIYDPCALELYSRVLQELPVGVPVRENGLGDWFLSAATQAAKYLGPALAMMPHPIAKGAGAALTYLGNTGNDYVKRQTPPNSWEQGSGGNTISKDDERLLVKGAKAAQKKKDDKKMKKKVAKAKAAQQK